MHRRNVAEAGKSTEAKDETPGARRSHRTGGNTTQCDPAGQELKRTFGSTCVNYRCQQEGHITCGSSSIGQEASREVRRVSGGTAIAVEGSPPAAPETQDVASGYELKRTFGSTCVSYRCQQEGHVKCRTSKADSTDTNNS